MVPIKCFAYLAESLGPVIEVELPETVTKEVILTTVANAFPLYKDDILSCSVAVNQQFINGETLPLAEAKEIALIPPVSGG